MALRKFFQNKKFIYSKYISYICDVYMVSAMIKISKPTNQILNIVKAKYSLKDKSQAIEKVVLSFGAHLLEPELKPEFIEKMQSRKKETTVKVKDFDKHFNI
jgi:hypothetical protein